MKFNSNQRYTRWSIRRLSVGVASVRVNWPINWVEKSQLQASTASEAPLPSFLTSLVVKIKL